MTRLEDVCEILDSQRVPITASDRIAGSYPYYGANGIQDYVADYLFDDELVLLAEDGGNFGSKTKPIAYRVSGKCWVNNHAHVLKPKPVVDVDYLCYSLMFYDVSALVNGATRQKLTQADMRKMIIPLRSMPEQKRIVDLLKKVDELISLRKKQLQKLDDLVKSRFVEMFGDPAQNTMGLPVKTLPEISDNLDSRRIPITSSDRKAGVFPYYGASGIVDYVENYIFDEDILLVSEDGANLLARVTPIAFSVSGKVWVNNHAHVIRFTDKAMQIYVEHLLNMIDISSFVTGTAQPKLNQAKMNSIPIPMPMERSLQAFLEFVKQNEKTKLTVQQGLDKLELLKQSLMQKCFG